MTRGYFVTGTDTGIGKTRVAQALIAKCARNGLRVSGMKPVASGCVATPDGLRNEDALALQAASSVLVPYALCNPYAFEPAIAPHIAAQRAGVSIDLNHLAECYHKIASQCDVVVVEGVGGWLVPLGGGNTVETLARVLELDVLLVVGMRLGCLNHAALTSRAISESGLAFAGWVANCPDRDVEAASENLDALRALLPIRFCGTIPWQPQPDIEGAMKRIDVTLPG